MKVKLKLWKLPIGKFLIWRVGLKMSNWFKIKGFLGPAFTQASDSSA